MTLTQPQARPVRRADEAHDEQPIGAIVTELKGDLSRLVSEQMAIAKVELKQEGKRAGKGAGLLGVAGFGGYMVLMFGSLAAVYGLGHLLGNGWAALIVTGAWALVALVAGLAGRSQLTKISAPKQTIAAVKENLAWARTLKK
ncbi:MAG: phage holin family protein [Actinocatenispora sp.]